ncbi:hypothetical protein SAMN04488009_1878 [Maribacter sedimenticola]|uniref:Uncharacterized protein n=1 Tax=Maribacter sedimenticola TaxID=228956 RepID=A0ABY1SHF0_9FLAO|nr:hypothetical protein SAMN04488009_1878 [Maribacter sedimenticola]
MNVVYYCYRHDETLELKIPFHTHCPTQLFRINKVPLPYEKKTFRKKSKKDGYNFANAPSRSKNKILNLYFYAATKSQVTLRGTK